MKMATRILNVLARTGSNCCSRAVQHAKRRFSSGTDDIQNICDISLSKSVPWIPAPKYANLNELSHDTHVTKLDNGMRVASEEKFGQFCTVGVLVDSGSRYEAAYPNGVSHYLEKLAFASTSIFKDRDVILQQLEQHGGICDCQGSRDTLIYAVSANTTGLSDVIQLLSEVTMKPQFTETEFEDCRQAIGFELEAVSMNPNPEALLVEMIHAAAYNDNTLGLPKICVPESMGLMDQRTLYTYLHHYHTPERMVLAGVGVEHDSLVEMAQQYFVNQTPIWSQKPDLIDPTRGQDLSISQYTGGHVAVEKDLSSVSLGPTPMPELAHLVIGLESCSHRDPDFIAFCVLNMLMGGGGSFSAGGPGKGMYTRLYLNVMNRYHWIHTATAYNHAYMDSGVFCIHAAAHPSAMKDLVEVIVKEFVNLQHGIAEGELNRAKTQLQSMLLMNLESRPVVFEDIGRQILGNGERRPAQFYYDEIAKVGAEDIQRVVRRMLGSVPSVAALGNLSTLPSMGDIQAALASKDGGMPKKFSLFKWS